MMTTITDIDCDFTKDSFKDWMSQVTFHVIRWFIEITHSWNMILSHFSNIVAIVSDHHCWIWMNMWDSLRIVNFVQNNGKTCLFTFFHSFIISFSHLQYSKLFLHESYHVPELVIQWPCCVSLPFLCKIEWTDLFLPIQRTLPTWTKHSSIQNQNWFYIFLVIECFLQFCVSWICTDIFREYRKRMASLTIQTIP